MKNANKPRIEFSSLFNKQLENASIEIRIAFEEVYEVFAEDPDNEVLRNHSLDKLGKKYFGMRSIDVTEDWRAVYRKEGEKIIFTEFGTHKDLYY